MINTEKEIMEILREYFKIKLEIKNLEDCLAEKRDEIIRIMKSRNVNKIETQLHVATYSKFETERLSSNKIKETLDAKGLRKIYDDCTYKSTQEKLTIKERKGSIIF